MISNNAGSNGTGGLSPLTVQEFAPDQWKTWAMRPMVAKVEAKPVVVVPAATLVADVVAKIEAANPMVGRFLGGR